METAFQIFVFAYKEKAMGVNTFI